MPQVQETSTETKTPIRLASKGYAALGASNWYLIVLREGITTE